MNKLLVLLAAGAIACSGGALAADPPAPNSQQDKMTACNKEAGDKKGDDRKAFMKSCLSATPAPVKAESRMAMCNKKTAGMAKEERAKAQSECMKAPS